MSEKISILSIILDEDNNDETQLYRDILLWPVKMAEEENVHIDSTQVTS